MNKSTLFSLLIPFWLAFLPHVFSVPLWVVFFSLLVGVYVFAKADSEWPLLPRWGRILLALFAFAAILLTFGRTIDRDAGIALLAVMLNLKFLEIKSQRDKLVSLFLIYFLIITNLLAFESLGIAIYVLFSVFVATVSLMRLNRLHPGLSEEIKKTAWIFAQALPLAVLLFFLFPRVEGSIWGGTTQNTRGLSGFSETMSPGSITSMARSNAVAFRVAFPGRIPPHETLYWRGLVLWSLYDRTWSRPDFIPRRSTKRSGSEDGRYTVTLEPHNMRWLFSLDYPESPPWGATLHADYVLRAWRPVKKTYRYKLSTTSAVPLTFDGWRKLALTLPKNLNPRTRELVDEWRKTSDDPKQLIDTALTYFTDNGFRYTLQPPALGEDSVDDFLFISRRGYCEHFASAFAYLMRAAGVPCRVVVGYQGGEINPYGDYLIIRQSHAHAWTEVWLEEQGWVRVDPTAHVSPARIEQGPEEALPPEETETFFSRHFSAAYGFFLKLRLQWDNVTQIWNTWVLDYGFYTQRRLLSRIGLSMDSWKTPALITGIVVLSASAILVLFSFIRLPGAKKRTDPVVRSYNRFCRKMARSGIPRRPGEGPRDFLQRIEQLRPDIHLEAAKILGLYMEIRYAGRAGKEKTQRLTRLVRRFSAG